MQTVASFSRGEDAHLFRTFLDSQGIEAYVFDEYVPQLFWQYTQAIGGVRVAVADEDLEAATVSHKEYEAALRNGPSVTRQVRAWPVVLLISIAMSMPLLLFGRKPFRHDHGIT